eukprot:15465830-Alexandrium_andersonii.AAC.1
MPCLPDSCRTARSVVCVAAWQVALARSQMAPHMFAWHRVLLGWVISVLSLELGAPRVHMWLL